MAKSPTKEQEVKTYRPEDLAKELGVSGKQIRAYLRSEFSRGPEAKGTSWTLTEDMAAKVVARFTPSEDVEEDEEL